MKYAYKNLKGNLVKCSNPKKINKTWFIVKNENGVYVLVKKDNLLKQVKHKVK